MNRQRIEGEIAQDRWQRERARDFIWHNHGRFVNACLFRATRFWSIWPGRSGETGLPSAILWLIAGGYVLLWLAGIVTTIRAIRQGHWRLLVSTGSLILGFFLVHLVYWTDARMRAPIIPALAILIAVGLTRSCPASLASKTNSPTDAQSA
jgi:hypothetical protein